MSEVTRIGESTVALKPYRSATEPSDAERNV